MELLTAAASLKLGQSALKLAGAAIKAAPKGELADLFEVGSGAVEFAGGLSEAQHVTVATTTARVQRRLERGYREMLEHEGADWALRADVKAVFLRLPEVLDAAQPDAQAIVSANLDTARIAALVADKAGLADDLFADGQIGRRILVDLVTAAYDEVKQDAQFAGPLRLIIDGELLRRTESVATKSDLENMLGRMLSRIGTEARVPVAVLREILAGFGESGNELDAWQIEQRLRAKAKEYYELRERLSRLTNDDPRVQALRREAAGLIDEGKFDAADSMLSEAENIDLVAIQELEGVADRRRASAAASRAERGAAARLRLDYVTAAAHFGEAAYLVARDDGAAWEYRMRQADALLSRGEEFGDNAALKDAIAVYREALHLTSGERIMRERNSRRWAAAQCGLGNALSRFGERESCTARLEEAVVAYRFVLHDTTRERVPLDWATTQNDLGNVLQALGARESGTALLHEAVAAYRHALQEWTREGVPLQWALAKNNLGTALAMLGQRENDTARLEEAVLVFCDALKERTRVLVPLQWATTNNNLGNALRALGTRENGTARLEEAVAAYRDALQERKRARVPLDWATTQHNLANALRLLGERERSTARLREAVAAYRDALLERKPERVPSDWAGTQNHLGIGLAALGARESGVVWLDEAVKAWDACLSVAALVWPADWIESVSVRRSKALAEIARRRAPAQAS